MLQLSSKLIPNEENITSSVIDGEAVLVNLSTGAYYSLLGAACDAWILFEQAKTLGEAAATLAARYEVALKEVEEDLGRFAEVLVAEGIASPNEQPETVANAAELPPATMAYKAPELEAYRDMEELLALDPPMPGLRDVPWVPGEGKGSKSGPA